MSTRDVEPTHTTVLKRVERDAVSIAVADPGRGWVGDVVRNDRTAEMFMIEGHGDGCWLVRRAVNTLPVPMHAGDTVIVVGAREPVR